MFAVQQIRKKGEAGLVWVCLRGGSGRVATVWECRPRNRLKVERQKKMPKEPPQACKSMYSHFDVAKE